MRQHCVCDHQVVGSWQDEKESWETTKPLENDLMWLEMGMDCNVFLWKCQSRLAERWHGDGSLVNTALFWVLHTSHPLWARSHQCNSSSHIPGSKKADLTCFACFLRDLSILGSWDQPQHLQYRLRGSGLCGMSPRKKVEVTLLCKHEQLVHVNVFTQVWFTLSFVPVLPSDHQWNDSKVT